MVDTYSKLPRLDKRHIKLKTTPHGYQDTQKRISNNSVAFIGPDDYYYATKYKRIMQKSYYQEAVKLDSAMKSIKTTNELRNSILSFSYEDMMNNVDRKLTLDSASLGRFPDINNLDEFHAYRRHKNIAKIADHKPIIKGTGYSGEHTVSKLASKVWEPDQALAGKNKRSFKNNFIDNYESKTEANKTNKHATTLNPDLWRLIESQDFEGYDEIEENDTFSNVNSIDKLTIAPKFKQFNPSNALDQLTYELKQKYLFPPLKSHKLVAVMPIKTQTNVPLLNIGSARDKPSLENLLSSSRINVLSERDMRSINETEKLTSLAESLKGDLDKLKSKMRATEFGAENTVNSWRQGIKQVKFLDSIIFEANEDPISETSKDQPEQHVNETMTRKKEMAIRYRVKPPKISIETAIACKEAEEKVKETLAERYVEEKRRKSKLKEQAEAAIIVEQALVVEQASELINPLIQAPDGEVISAGISYEIIKNVTTDLDEFAVDTGNSSEFDENLVYRLYEALLPFLYYTRRLDKNVHLEFRHDHEEEREFEVLKTSVAVYEANKTLKKFNYNRVLNELFADVIVQYERLGEYEGDKDKELSVSVVTKEIKSSVNENYKRLLRAYKNNDISSKEFIDYTRLMRTSFRKLVEKTSIFVN